MKKITLVFIMLFLPLHFMKAQGTISVSGVTAGDLSNAITVAGGDLNTVANLTVSGTIDARDFLTMRDNMPLLAIVDLSGVTIDAYGTSPANVIPRGAFFNVENGTTKPNLTNCILPTSITGIDHAAFFKTGLFSIVIPNTVTYIGSTVFAQCPNLTSVTLSSALESIGIYAFSHCRLLTGIAIPPSVTFIDKYAFDGCWSITSITLPNISIIEECVFRSCSSLSSLTIPSSVHTIKNQAFLGCSSLTSISIPASVINIESFAFDGCSALLSINVLSSNPINLSGSTAVFRGVNKNICFLIVPFGSENAYYNANQWKDFIISSSNTLPRPTGLRTQIYSGDATLLSLNLTGNAIKWYQDIGAGSALPISTPLVDGSTYFASQTINNVESGARFPVTVRKISESQQFLCSSNTVSNLSSTPLPSFSTVWYSSLTDNTPLDPNTLLTSGTYYVEQRKVETTITQLGYGFRYPKGIALQNDGKIIVADYGNNLVKRMDYDGSNIEVLGSGFDRPKGVAIQADGKIVIAQVGRIKRMESDGSNIVELAQVYDPSDVAIEADGKILFSERFTTPHMGIKRMNHDGSNLQTVNSVSVSRPEGIFIQPDGKILVANSGSNNIVRMNSDGSNAVILRTGFFNPEGVVSQPDGKIVIADTNFSKIKRMDSNGANLENLGDFYGPSRVLIEPDGAILFSEYGNNAIKRLKTESIISNRVAVSIVVSNENTVSLGSTNFINCIENEITPLTHITTGASGIGTPVGLPAGLTANWSSNTITISGTPTESGIFSYSIPLTGGCGNVSATGNIVVNGTQTEINLKLFLEGYYDINSDSMVPVKLNQGIGTNINYVDDILIELRDTATGLSVANTLVELQTNGSASVKFPCTIDGTYYLVVKHRNSIQTWSANPITLSPGTIVNYDFTNNLSNAYGNNMKEVESGVFALFTGDINQDDIIDPLDYSLWESDSDAFSIGYLPTDLNGDGVVDPSDYSIWEVNSDSFIVAIYPTF